MLNFLTTIEEFGTYRGVWTFFIALGAIALIGIFGFLIYRAFFAWLEAREWEIAKDIYDKVENEIENEVERLVDYEFRSRCLPCNRKGKKQ